MILPAETWPSEERTLKPVYVSPFRYLYRRWTVLTREQDWTHLHVVTVRRTGRRVTHSNLYRGRVGRRVFGVCLVQHERRRVVSQVLSDARHLVDD